MLRRSAPALCLGLVALLAPVASAQEYLDPAGDAAGDLDIESVTVTYGEGTIGVQVLLRSGQTPEDRAVRGVVVLGSPGETEPAEWYQFTIANETAAYVAHGPTPHLAQFVATSWNGSLASAEWRREDPAAAPQCAYAVVEAGTMDSTGFVRSDVAPPGFVSPEEAWPVDQCPSYLIREFRERDEAKESPGFSLLAVVVAVAFVAALRRR